MKKTALAAIMLLFALCAMAVPAKQGIIKIKQPDGSSLSIMLHGDENWHYTTTSDGYLVQQDEEGYYVYAQMNNGIQTATSIRAHKPAKRTSEEIAYIQQAGKFEMSQATIATIRQTKAMERESQMIEPMAKASMIAERNLVILVSFKDKAFTHTNKDFHNQLNQKGYSDNKATGSVRDYFIDASNGQYQPTFDVFGPYALDKDMEYYGKNRQSGGDQKADQMIVDAFNKLINDASANFNLSNYDSNNDGYIDNIFIIYAGHSESEGAESNAVWPHRWEVSKYYVTGNITHNGYTLRDYACSAELKGKSGSNMAGIGTFCHEFSHILGLVDFYNTTNSGSHKTCGKWDIMDQGSYNNSSHTPPTYSAHQRFFLGWLTPTIINTPNDLELKEIMSSNSAYLISHTGTHNLQGKNPIPQEYILLENRQKKGWDKYIPGHGMLITKTIYNTQTWWNNSPNNNPNSMGYDIIEAAENSSISGNASDSYPGSENVTSYTPYSQYPISAISENNELISFKFMGGTLTYTVTLDGRGIGLPEQTTLTETGKGSGITLPDVIVSDDKYKFEGWCTNVLADQIDAGTAGSIFHPEKKCTLYAVYSVNGEIVIDDNMCFVETFNKFSSSISAEITKDINSYTDRKGWTGKKIYTEDKIAKIGTNKYKGYITTPPIHFGNDITIKITGYAKGANTIYATASKDSITASAHITSKMDTITMRMYGFVKGSTITLHTDNVLYMDHLEICPTNTTDAPIIETNETFLVGNYGIATLYNLPVNCIINCYNITGQLLWSKEPANSEMQFTAPNSMYLIQIITPERQFTLKGVNF